MAREFSKELFNGNNQRAIDAATKYFRASGWDVTQYPDGKYGIDLAISKGSVHLLIEPEVKRDWEEGIFTFSDLRIPFRKEKYCTANTYFMIFSNSLKDFFLIHSLKLGPVETVRVGKNLKADIQPEKFYINDTTPGNMKGSFFRSDSAHDIGNFPFDYVDGSYCFLSHLDTAENGDLTVDL